VHEHDANGSRKGLIQSKIEQALRRISTEARSAATEAAAATAAGTAIAANRPSDGSGATGGVESAESSGSMYYDDSMK